MMAFLPMMYVEYVTVFGATQRGSSALSTVGATTAAAVPAPSHLKNLRRLRIMLPTVLVESAAGSKQVRVKTLVFASRVGTDTLLVHNASAVATNDIAG